MQTAPEVEQASEPSALERGRRWIAVGLGVGALGYLAYAAWHGWRATGAALAGFDWPLYGAVVALTLVNYGLRYWKWTYLLGRVGVRLDHRTNLWIYATGLAMVLSPGKVGELVKPWLVRTTTGASMIRTVPALVTERVTDAIAVIGLAGIGVGTYASDDAGVVVGMALAFAAGLLVLAVEPVSLGLLGLLGRIPLVGRFAPRLVEMYRAMRRCVAPLPLVLTVLVSVVAWWAECVGMWLVFRGLDVPASLDVSTFLYASATVLGGPSPGGLGIADAALAEGALALVAGIGSGEAMAAALLIRVATLWLGVVIGAVALIRIEGVIRRRRDRSPRPRGDDPAP